MMNAAEPYNSIEKKKSFQETSELTELEALIKTLNIMDFNAAIAAQNSDVNTYERTEHEWVELNFIDNDSE